MEGEEEAVDSPTSYSSKSYPQKIAILLAGVTMNVIIAYIAVTIALCISGVVTNSIDTVVAGSPAEAAGLKHGDTIVAVNGIKTESWEQVSEGIGSYKEGEDFTITYVRDGSSAEATLTPEYNEELQGYKIGITAGVSKNFFKCAKQGPAMTWELAKAMLQGFKMLFTRGLHKEDVAGPVGLVKIVDQASDYGPGPYFMLLALVSLNLALFNLIPIPGLDGGKIFFIFLKIISGGRINDNMEYKATLVGMALLLLLFVIITMNDISNLFAG